MMSEPLGSIAKIIAGQSPASSTYNLAGDGLPFFQGKADFQEMYPSVRMWCTSKKRKEAEAGDILISVRAPVGSVNICNQKSIIGRGLSAIRPSTNLNGLFLYFFLKANEKQIDALGTGSTFKAITQETLKRIEIPLPPLDDQKRIAHLLGKVEGLIVRRKQHLQQLDNLLKSVFLEMFGDPVRNEKGWEKKPLGLLGNLDRGISKHRPRNAPELLGGKYPLIQTGDVTNAGTYITGFTQTYSERGFAQSKLWPAGTLCITIAANIAQTGILTFDACFPDSVVGFSTNKKKSNPLYVHGLFWFFQRILEKNAPAAAQKNINLKILRGLEVPAPSLDFQNQFAGIVEKVEGIKTRYRKSLADLEQLYGALSQKAFKGELDLSRVPLPIEEPDITGEEKLEAEDMQPTASAFELPEPASPASVTSPEGRKTLLDQWLTAWIEQPGNADFSAQSFMDAARERMWELVEDEAPGWDVAEYDQLKAWVFEALEQGRLTQSFDAAGNSVRITAAKE